MECSFSYLASFRKILLACRGYLAEAQNHGFDFNKRSQLFIASPRATAQGRARIALVPQVNLRSERVE